MRARAGIVTATMAAAVVLGSATEGAAAGVPQLLTEQGRLFDVTGNPVSGATKFVFNLYTSAAGGTSLWTETQTITLDSGFFSAELGSVNALTPAVVADATSSGSPLYLGITVASDPELSPRQHLLSVPYALASGNAVGDITPHSISVNGKPVVDSTGAWVGAPATSAPGPAGPAGAPGAPGPAGAMTSGVGPGIQVLGTPLKSGTSGAVVNTLVPAVQNFNVGAASTHCSVAITAYYCTAPLGTSVAQPPNAVASVAFALSGNDIGPAGFPCYFPSPSLASGIIANEQCVSCSTTWVVGVAAGGTYDFGCDFGLAGVASANMAGYCQTAVTCF